MSEKTVQEVIDTMNEEQQMALYLMYDAILGNDSDKITHYGIKGMKWGKSKVERAADLAKDSAALAVDLAEFEVKKKSFEASAKKGNENIFGALKLGVAQLMLKARTHILKIRLGQIPMFGRTLIINGKGVKRDE